MFASSWNWIVDEIVRPLEPATVLIQMILFGIAGALFMRHRLQNISQSDKARIEQLKNQITFEEKRIDKLVVAIKTLAEEKNQIDPQLPDSVLEEISKEESDYNEEIAVKLADEWLTKHSKNVELIINKAKSN